jgi:hypothetical protein
MALIESETEQVCTERAYDPWKCYDVIECRRAKVAISPHKNVVI